MKPVRVLIVDDERPARLKIRRHLKNRPEVGSIEEAHDGLAAVETIRRDPPDLVFLDIQMPGLNGFEVIEAVGVDTMPKVVFVTAFDDHAIAAFDVEALDYLLKPYSDERFDKAFTRALECLGSDETTDRTALSRLQAGERFGGDRLRRIVVGDRDRLELVSIAKVTHLTAAGNYVEVHAEGVRHLVRATLADMERRLDADRFTRIHRSTIVNLDHVKVLQADLGGDYEVILRDGTVLRLSRRYKDRIFP